MELVQVEPPHAPPPPDPRRQTQRRAGWVAVVVVVAVLLLAAFFGTRQVLAWQDRSQVHVVVDASPLECDGTTVEVTTSSSSPPVAVPRARLRPEMRCRFRFLVLNRGRRPVHLEQVSLPTLGPGGGGGAMAVALEASGGTAGTIRNDAAAVFDLRLMLTAGSSTDLVLLLAFRPNGCELPGGGVTLVDAPTVKVRSWGIAGHRSLTGEPFGSIGTELSSCQPGSGRERP